VRKLVLLFLVVTLLTACRSASTPQPTAAPVTEPPVPPPTSDPVEMLAGSADDLFGGWWFTQAGDIVEIDADGTYRVFSDSKLVEEGDYTFEGGKVTWVTGHPICNDEPATYEVYITKQIDKPTWLRWQVVGSDPCQSRVNTLRSKAKFLNP